LNISKMREPSDDDDTLCSVKIIFTGLKAVIPILFKEVLCVYL